MRKSQKHQVAGKLMDLGNLGFATLVFSQMISGAKFNILLAFLGVFVLILTYLWAIILAK